MDMNERCFLDLHIRSLLTPKNVIGVGPRNTLGIPCRYRLNDQVP